MKKIKLLLVFTLITAGIISLPSCQSSKTSTASKMLKFNLEKGKGYNYDMVWDMDMKTGGQNSRVSIDGKYTMNIVEDDGSVKTVATTYKSIRMVMDVMGMHFEMDTDKPVGATDSIDIMSNPMSAMNKVMTGLTNKTFLVKVDAEGNVLEVTGFDKIISDMVDSLGMSEEIKAQTMLSMKEQFSEKSLKDNFAQMFTIFPNKEVKVGDTWNKSYATGGRMGAKFNTTYTVKDIDGEHVSLRSESKISSSEEGGELEGTQTGNIVVDSKTGLVITAEYDQDMEMKTKEGNIEINGKGKIKGKAL